MSQIKNKLTLNLILIFSIFALSAAYFIQYVLDHKPCNLCLIERLPYIFAIVIIFLNIIFKKFEKTDSYFSKLNFRSLQLLYLFIILELNKVFLKNL